MHKTKLNNISLSELTNLIAAAKRMTDAGSCCPRMCAVNRSVKTPPCGAVSGKIRVASFSVHKGEEPPVSGVSGAGNVFFSGCTMKCVFCQNYPFSQMNNGKDYTEETFAQKVLYLQNKKNVHNINLTTADHYMFELLASLSTIKDELSIPISNNCSGYYRIENLALISKITDIFLFDLKYSDDAVASKYSQINSYVEVSRNAAAFFLDNPLQWIEEDGILKQGLVFRHLVLPGDIENTLRVLDFAASLRDRGLEFKFSLMCQYFPAWKAAMHPEEYPKLQQKLGEDDYDKAVLRMDELGLDGWAQDMDAQGGC